MTEQITTNDAALNEAAANAREAGAEWLLQAEVMHHIPLLFGQHRVIFEHFASKQECQSSVSRLYNMENGYRTKVYDLKDQDGDALIPFDKAIVGSVYIENTDMKRLPERIHVLPFNRMFDIHKHLEAMFNRDLALALAYEHHRRIKLGQPTNLEKLVLELIDKGQAGAHDIPAARSVDKRLEQLSPEKGKWHRVAMDQTTVRYMLSLENPSLPYYAVKTPGEDFHLTFVVPKSSQYVAMEYREKVDEFYPCGVGPYQGNEVKAIDTDARKRGLPPLLNIERE